MKKTLSNSLEFIKSDLYRYGGKVTFMAFFKNWIFNRSFNYMFWFRLGQSNLRSVRWPAMVMHRCLTLRYGVHIPLQTQVGYGLYIGHGMGLVVNPTTRIGNNCNLSQFTTIGSNHNNAAHIGDDVYIGPSVCIIEHVIIGDSVTIGAGSVVVKDVPTKATVAGVPAKIISFKEPGRYIQFRWSVPPAPASLT